MLYIAYQNANGFGNKVCLTTEMLEIETPDTQEILALSKAETIREVVQGFFADRKINDVQVFASGGRIVLQGLEPENKVLV